LSGTVVGNHDSREPNDFNKDDLIYEWLQNDFVQEYNLTYIPEKYFEGADIPKTSSEVEDSRKNKPYWLISYNRISPLNATQWNVQNIEEYNSYSMADDGGALHERRAYNKSDGERQHISIHSVSHSTNVFKYNNTSGDEQRFEDETVRYISNNGTVRGVYAYEAPETSAEGVENELEESTKVEIELEEIVAEYRLKVYTQDVESGARCVEANNGCYVTEGGVSLPPDPSEIVSQNETRQSPNTHGTIDLNYTNLSKYVRWTGKAEWEIEGKYTTYYTVKKYSRERDCELSDFGSGYSCPSWPEFPEEPDEVEENVTGENVSVDVLDVNKSDVLVEYQKSNRYGFVRPDNFGGVHPEDQTYLDNQCGTDVNYDLLTGIGGGSLYDESNPLERLFIFNCAPAMSVIEYPDGSAEVIFRGNFRTRDDNWSHPIPSVKIGDKEIHTGWNYYTSRNESWDDLYQSGSKENDSSYPSKVRPIETKAFPVKRDFGSTGYFAIDVTYLFDQPISKNVPRMLRHESCVQTVPEDMNNSEKVLCTVLLVNTNFSTVENMNEAEELWYEKKENETAWFTPGAVQYGEYENEKHPYNKEYQPIESVYIRAPEYNKTNLTIEGFVHEQNLSVSGDESIRYEVQPSTTEVKLFGKYNVDTDEGNATIKGQVRNGSGIELPPDKNRRIDYWNESDRKWAPIKIEITNPDEEVLTERPVTDYVIIEDSVPVTNDDGEIVRWEAREINISETQNEDGYVYAIVSRDTSNINVRYNSSHWTELGSFRVTVTDSWDQSDWENRLYTDSSDTRINPTVLTINDMIQFLLIILLTVGVAFAFTQYILVRIFDTDMDLSNKQSAKEAYGKTAGTIVGSFKKMIFGFIHWLPTWIKVLIILALLLLFTDGFAQFILTIIRSIQNAFFM